MKIFNTITLIPILSSLLSAKNIQTNDIFNKEIIISIKDNSALKNKEKLLKELKLKNINFNSLKSLDENEHLSKYYLFNFNAENDYNDSFNKLKTIDEILYVEENKIVLKDINDEYLKSDNINLINSSYKINYEIIKSEDAKSLTGEDNKINVAIIDSGINFSTSFLNNKLDTKYSKSFISGKEYNEYRSGHGTMVSYIIGGTSNNSLYSSGICENVNLISLMISELASTADFVSIMNYVNSLDIEIPLINCSYSMGGDTSDIMREKVENFNGLFICSAANDKLNLDDSETEVYPAKYSSDNMIVVGESTIENEKSTISNYGQKTVDIFAPSEDIYTVNEKGSFVKKSGTSFAAPLVTGACALMLSKDNSLSMGQVKARIMSYADKIDSLKDYCINGNRLNVFNSVHASNHIQTYKWKNVTSHLKICSICEESSLDGHTISGGTILNGVRYGTCIYCKGKAQIGFITETCSLNPLEDYDLINGLYYPKETQIINGITDLSYKDSLNYE